jgi:hypothetical protein
MFPLLGNGSVNMFPLLGNGSVNMFPLLGNGSVNMFPLQQTDVQKRNGVFCVVLAEMFRQRTRIELSQLSVESQAVKKRPGGWCEMAANLEVSQLKH